MRTTRWIAWLLGAAILIGMSAPAAYAGSKGKRNTALVLGGVAAYGIIKKKPLIAGLAGGGAIYSYMKSREARKKELRREQNRRRYRARYRRR